MKLRQRKVEQLLDKEDIDIKFKDCKMPARKPSESLGESSTAMQSQLLLM